MRVFILSVLVMTRGEEQRSLLLDRLLTRGRGVQEHGEVKIPSLQREASRTQKRLSQVEVFTYVKKYHSSLGLLP